MVHLTIKKENCESWTSFKKHYTFKHKCLKYWIRILVAKIKKCEVEVLKDD